MAANRCANRIDAGRGSLRLVLAVMSGDHQSLIAVVPKCWPAPKRVMYPRCTIGEASAAVLMSCDSAVAAGVSRSMIRPVMVSSPSRYNAEVSG